MRPLQTSWGPFLVLRAKISRSFGQNNVRLGDKNKDVNKEKRVPCRRRHKMSELEHQSV